jgi:hypothetical protein
LVKAMSEAAGFTIKSGWASAVLVTGSAATIQVIDSRRIDLSDPALPESRQPYHAGFGTARSGGPELARLVASVERFGRQSVTDAIDRYQRAGYQLRGAGIVAGSVIDPDTIRNAHIRIHALEGRLFRQVVEDAAAHRRLPCWIWREKDLYAVAAHALHKQESELRRVLKACGETTNGSWRAEQKAATLAAWLVLAGRTVGGGRRVKDGRRGRRADEGGRKTSKLFRENSCDLWPLFREIRVIRGYTRCCSVRFTVASIRRSGTSHINATST